MPYDPAALLENPSITWIGHATFLVRMDGVTFLTDPMFSKRASPVSFAGPKRLVPPGVPLDALPPIDFVTLSHDHYDHTDLPSIAALAKRGTRFVAGLGMGDLVRDAGGEVVELDWWQSTTIGAGDDPLRAGAALLGAQRSSAATSACGRAGWSRDRRGASTTPATPATSTGFREIGARLGPIDLAAMPIGAYEPTPTSCASST